MKHLAFALVVLVAACSSADPPRAPAAAPPVAPDVPEADADAGVAPSPADPYVQAVLGAKWTKLEGAPSVPRGKMDDIFFPSREVGYAVKGSLFGIAKTTDGGRTWRDVLTKDATYFRALAFVDAQHGFAGNLGAGLSPAITDETVLYETRNGGESWAQVTTISGPKPQFCNFDVIDGDHIVAVGRTNGPAHVLMSADRGATWTSTDLGAHLSMLVDVHFSTKDEGVIVGMNASGVPSCTVMRTTDGGATYTKVFASKTENSLCWKVDFPTPQVGFVAIQDTTNGPATIAKTTDGGKTWVEKALPVKTNGKGAYPTLAVGFVDERIGWLAADDARLPTYRTIDGGETWEEDPSLVAPINRFRFLDRSTAYAIGGAIWKLDIAAP